MTSLDSSTPPPGSGQCQVTGKWVPEDELVTIQGLRVCAEGKQILLERLRAGEGIPGQLEAPSILRRFGGSFVDGLIVIVIWIACLSLTVGIMVFRRRVSQTDLFTVGSLAVGLQVGLFAYLTVMHGKVHGQTLGKMAARIRVTNLDGSPISMKTAFIRAAAYTGPSLVSAILQLVLLLSMSQAIVVARIATTMVVVYGLINSICALVDGDQQRALHDRIAKTRVVVVS